MKQGKLKINSNQKEVLRALVLFRCQICGRNEKEVGKLQPHRIIQGNKGGYYTPNNILMVCAECHKTLH